MRKTVTIMMSFLMLASVLINIGGFELEQVEIDESSGRSAEANLTTVLSPRATVTEMGGEKRGAILAGEGTEFDIVVINEGDAAITEMNIVVTVYLTGGNIAQDASGSDLQWTDSVICDDLFSCEFATLGANSYLSGGAYTVKTLDPTTSTREPVVWVPIVGNYEIVVSLEIPEASQDSISSNNELMVPVSVVDWFDIEVDLSWIDSNGDPTDVSATGSDNKTFTLTVSLDGSSNWDARNISIALSASGNGLSSATGEDAADLAVGHSIMAGTLNNSAIVWQNMSDVANASSPDFQQFGPRYELNWGETFTYTGMVEPDSTITSGTYEVTALLMNFKVLAQKADCMQEEDVIIENGPDNVSGTEDDVIVTMQVIHLCDDGESVADDVNANSEDEIMGGVSNFHDISVVDMTVLQGYDVSGNDPSYFFKNGDTVSVGYSRIMVEVNHRGSDTDEHYDWQVDISIVDYQGAEVATYTADSCVNGMPAGMTYSHKFLGIDADMSVAELSGFACPVHEFGNGEYTVTATVSMINLPVDHIGDMAGSNDDATAAFVAFNNLPVVSMALETSGDILTGDVVTFTLSAFDADCPGGECMSFNWSRMRSDGTLDEMAMCDTTDDGTLVISGWACSSPSGPDWTGSNAVWVIATDTQGGESLPSYAFPHVWNLVVVSASSGDVDMTYSITTDMLTPMTFNIVDLAQFTSISLPSIADTVDSVVAVDYDPSVSYIPENVLTQSFSIVFEGDTGGDYTLWYRAGNTWGILSDVVDAYDSSHVMMNVSDFSGGTLGAGTLAVFEGAVAGSPPTATISNFNAVAAGSGDVELTWNINGTMTPIDSFKIFVDDAEAAALPHDSDRVWRDKGLDHGESHDYSVKICNAYGCNPTEGSKPGVAADNEVSPASGVGGVSFTENTTHVLVAWTSTNTSDVNQWKVCWDVATFDGNAVGLEKVSCVLTGSSDATHAIAKMTPQGTHNMYVSVGGVDNLANAEENGQMGNTAYENLVDLDIDPGADIGSGGDETLPSWAWPAIIGVVVIAFVAGAFILSRGGDGDDNKDWDY